MKSLKLIALVGLVAFATNAYAADEKKSKLDADGDGSISAEEIAKAPEKLQAKLKEADKDGDGALSKEEYEAFKASMKKKDK